MPKSLRLVAKPLEKSKKEFASPGAKPLLKLSYRDILCGMGQNQAARGPPHISVFVSTFAPHLMPCLHLGDRLAAAPAR